MNKAEKTRQYIVEKTAPIFNMKGYAGTSLHDMTEATGLTKGSIYGNFENKDEVALAAFEYNYNCIAIGIRTLQAERTSPLQKIMAYTDFYKTISKQTVLKGGCPIVNTGSEADDTHPVLREKVKTVVSNWKKNVEKYTKDGIAAGEIKKSVDPAAFSALLITLIEGGILMSKITGNLQFIHEAIKQLEFHIEHYIKE